MNAPAPHGVDAREIDRIVEWMIDGARPMRPPTEVVNDFCLRLAAAGVGIERCVVYVATLHPLVLGRRFIWRRGQDEVQLDSADIKLETNASFTNSPISTAVRTGRTLRAHLEQPPKPDEFEFYAEMRQEGVTDYLCQPLAFINGENHVVTWATKRKGGFSRAELGAMKAVRAPLARIAEVYALRRTTINPLDTYVGHSAGGRILSGHIRRGDTESIHAAIWLADLRGFTNLSDTIPGKDLIALLNEYFDRLVVPIQSHEGEVLKFMGDGLLAIFPTSDTRREADVCADSMAAAREARVRMEELNRERGVRGQAALQWGLALHVGEVLYGNIGGAARLDFTAIGPAVNLAARLEALAGRMGRNLVVSSAVAKHCGAGLVPLGPHELRGFRAAEEVYGLAEEQVAGMTA